MVSSMTLLASCDSDPSIMALHDQISFITHCYNHLDVMNTVVLLAVALASGDADVSGDSVKRTEKVMLHLISIILN